MSWRASEVLRKPGPGCVLGVVKSPAALPANFPREKVQGLGSLEVREGEGSLSSNIYPCVAALVEHTEAQTHTPSLLV